MYGAQKECCVEAVAGEAWCGEGDNDIETAPGEASDGGGGGDDASSAGGAGGRLGREARLCSLSLPTPPASRPASAPPPIVLGGVPNE
jgi:hypothetical protein